MGSLELGNVILDGKSKENLKMTIEKVKQNKGVPGIDKMTVQEVEEAKGNI